MNDKDLLNIANHKKIIYFEKLSLLENYKLDLLNRMTDVISDIRLSFICHCIENDIPIDDYAKKIFCYHILMTLELDTLNKFNSLKCRINDVFDCHRDNFEINRLIFQDSVELLNDSICKAFIEPVVVLLKRIYRNIEKGVRKIWDIQ